MRLKELQEEKETLKSLNNKYKNQFEDLKDKLLNYQEMNFKLNDQIKNLDQRNSNCRYQLSAVKNIIRDKNNEISNLKEELISVEFFKNDKDKFTTQSKFIEDNLKICKEELEKKTKMLREVEKKNTEFRLKSDEYFIENKLIKTDNPHKAYVEMLNEKQKIIINLQKENLVLKDEIAKYDEKFEVVFTQSRKETKSDQAEKVDDNDFQNIDDKNNDNDNSLNKGKNEIDNADREENQELNVQGIY